MAREVDSWPVLAAAALVMRCSAPKFDCGTSLHIPERRSQQTTVAGRIVDPDRCGCYRLWPKGTVNYESNSIICVWDLLGVKQILSLEKAKEDG